MKNAEKNQNRWLLTKSKYITCCPKLVKTQRPWCLEDEEARTTNNWEEEGKKKTPQNLFTNGKGDDDDDDDSFWEPPQISWPSFKK